MCLFLAATARKSEMSDYQEPADALKISSQEKNNQNKQKTVGIEVKMGTYQESAVVVSTDLPPQKCS